MPCSNHSMQQGWAWPARGTHLSAAPRDSMFCSDHHILLSKVKDRPEDSSCGHVWQQGCMQIAA